MRFLDGYTARLAPWIPKINLIAGLLALPFSLILIGLSPFVAIFALFGDPFRAITEFVKVVIIVGMVFGLIFSGIFMMKKDPRGWRLAILGWIAAAGYAIFVYGSVFGVFLDLVFLYTLIRHRTLYGVPENTEFLGLVGLVNKLAGAPVQPTSQPQQATPQQPMQTVPPPPPQAPTQQSQTSTQAAPQTPQAAPPTQPPPPPPVTQQAPSATQQVPPQPQQPPQEQAPQSPEPVLSPTQQQPQSQPAATPSEQSEKK